MSCGLLILLTNLQLLSWITLTFNIEWYKMRYVSTIVLIVYFAVLYTSMLAVKKAVKGIVDREQKRILIVSLTHDEQLMVKGDNLSVANVDANEGLKEVFKMALKETPENAEDETSYNFGKILTFSETDDLDFPKMSTKLGGKNWKAAEAATTLSRYFAILGFGLNSSKTYGLKEDKPVWWPRRPKWKKFRSPSKVSKEECTMLIRLLLEHYGIDVNVDYIGYPEGEHEESSSDSSEDDSKGDVEGVSGGGDTVPNEDDADVDSNDEDFGILNDEEMDSRRTNYVLLGKRRRGT